MPEPVRVGVVGTSWWTDTVLLPSVASCERAKVAAICGRTRERADELAAKYGVTQVFTDYRQMIERGTLDALIVATPDDSHYEIVMEALEHGLHILCEKPIALNADHAKAMADKAKAAQVKHMVMYSWHWIPAIQQMKRLIDEGYIGKIYHGNFRWVTDFGRGSHYQWRYDADRANGTLGDLGSHLIHLAQWMLGDVAAVSARLGNHIQRESLRGQPLNPANDSALLTLEFTSGTLLQMTISAVADKKYSKWQKFFDLHGENGSLEGRASVGAEYVVHLHGGQTNSENMIDEEIRLDLLEHFKTESVGPREFIDAIVDDRQIYPGLYEGYKVQQVIDAALESHRSGCRVTIVP